MSSQTKITMTSWPGHPQKGGIKNNSGYPTGLSGACFLRRITWVLRGLCPPVSFPLIRISQAFVRPECHLRDTLTITIIIILHITTCRQVCPLLGLLAILTIHIIDPASPCLPEPTVFRHPLDRRLSPQDSARIVKPAVSIQVREDHRRLHCPGSSLETVVRKILRAVYSLQLSSHPISKTRKSCVNTTKVFKKVGEATDQLTIITTVSAPPSNFSILSRPLPNGMKRRNIRNNSSVMITIEINVVMEVEGGETVDMGTLSAIIKEVTPTVTMGTAERNKIITTPTLTILEFRTDMLVIYTVGTLNQRTSTSL